MEFSLGLVSTLIMDQYLLQVGATSASTFCPLKDSVLQEYVRAPLLKH